MTKSAYKPFVIFEFDESGNRKRLNITEKQFRENNGRNVLDPTKVLVIVKDDLRRIFLWTGKYSHVRKRFISSRAAQELQEELMMDAKYYRCQILSVDQGNEPSEFLNAFGMYSNDEEGPLSPYIFKPPTPPGDLSASGEPQAKQSITKEEEEYEPYCKHCGAELSKGQTICHACGKKVI